MILNWYSTGSSTVTMLRLHELDRVFDRDDVLGEVDVDIVHHGRQGGGLAAARGPGHQQHAAGLGEDLLEDLEGLAAEAHVFHPDGEVGSVEDSDDQLLARQGGHAADAQVDLPTFGDQANSPFLGQALFGDVHPGHDLHPRDDQRVHARGR
ncbi:MAG: hypothetical protein NT031_09245, partial [Planctomycetota bacterium]|nr:hypothetical protein [Planctomycetota bacterium]